MNTVSITRGSFLVALVVTLGLFVSIIPFSAHAATCSFARDLKFGMVGEDVLCLQQYLNASGFTIAETGVGSKGKETDEFKKLTEAALVKWQETNGVTPASGMFGPKSRAAYLILSNNGTTITGVKPTPAPTVSQTIITPNTTHVKPTSTVPVVKTETKSAEEVKAREALKNAISAIEDAENAIDDNADAKDISSAKENLADAKSDLVKAVRIFLKNEYTKSVKSAKDAEDTATNALDTATQAKKKVKDAISSIGKKGGGDYDVAKMLKSARKELKNARNDVHDASENGDNVRKSVKKLDKAEKLLDDAGNAMDNDDENEAGDIINEASDLINDARGLL